MLRGQVKHASGRRALYVHPSAQVEAHLVQPSLGGPQQHTCSVDLRAIERSIGAGRGTQPVVLADAWQRTFFLEMTFFGAAFFGAAFFFEEPFFDGIAGVRCLAVAGAALAGLPPSLAVC